MLRYGSYIEFKIRDVSPVSATQFRFRHHLYEAKCNPHTEWTQIILWEQMLVTVSKNRPKTWEESPSKLWTSPFNNSGQHEPRLVLYTCVVVLNLIFCDCYMLFAWQRGTLYKYNECINERQIVASKRGASWSFSHAFPVKNTVGSVLETRFN